MPEREEQDRTLRCTDIAGLLPFYLNRSLEEDEARKVEAHLATCAACRREERDTRIAWDLHEGHLPVELLLDFAFARPMSSERQSVVESHLSMCQRCSEEVATVRQEYSGADSQEHIKRLIRELDLPDQADQVIQKAKYWTPAFCWLYFEKCDELIFDDGHAGLRAAKVGPELVELVSRFSRDPEPRAPLRLRAFGVLGSAFRAAGDLARADEIYQDGLRLVKAGQIPATEKANFLFRLAVLRSVQNRMEDALRLAGGSVRIYRESDEPIRQRHLGEALVIRGHLYGLVGDNAAAMKDWSEALSCTDPKKRPRIHHCASHNLAYALVEKGAVDSRSLSTVESHLTKARKFLSKRPRSKQKLRLVWLQGIIMMRFGSTRRGEAAFKTARRGFVEMKAAFELALVSLDLGRYLYRSGELEELRMLAVETQQIFSTLCADPQANQALIVWRDAVLARTVSTEAFANTWQAVQQRAIETSQRLEPV